MNVRRINDTDDLKAFQNEMSQKRIRNTPTPPVAYPAVLCYHIYEGGNFKDEVEYAYVYAQDFGPGGLSAWNSEGSHTYLEHMTPDPTCWFTAMAIRHCGKDYGSPRVNQYRFYRTVYHMTATEAWGRVNK